VCDLETSRMGAPYIYDISTLRVKSTTFLQRNIHKYTWTSPDGKTHNQIDHILIDRRWQSSVLDYEVVGKLTGDTDHYLVVAKLGKDW